MPGYHWFGRPGFWQHLSLIKRKSPNRSNILESLATAWHILLIKSRPARYVEYQR